MARSDAQMEFIQYPSYTGDNIFAFSEYNVIWNMLRIYRGKKSTSVKIEFSDLVAEC